MGVSERVQQVIGDPECLGHAEAATSVQVLAEGCSLHVAHHEVNQPITFAGIQQPSDVRVIESGGKLDLTEEALRGNTDQEFGMEDLEGNVTATRVLSQEDPGVAALSYLPLDLVLAGKGLAHQRQHVAPNGRLLWSNSMLVQKPPPRKSPAPYSMTSLRISRRTAHQRAPQIFEVRSRMLARPV